MDYGENFREIKRRQKREQLGPVAQKIILLLASGFSLSLTNRPDQYFRVIKKTQKEWEKINQRSLHQAIRNLYQSHLVNYKEDAKGISTLILSDKGSKQVLKYNLDKIKIQKSNWDGFWRLIIFDIPEFKKKERDALSLKFKQLGLCTFQKSVFIYSYHCKNEIDFIAEIFEVKPYVRYIVAKEIDTALDWQRRFNLL